MGVRRGRYELYDVIGEGGMASVHLGILGAPGGFRRVVAIKRLHPELARQKDFTRLLVDEAKLASRIVHANVVPVLDVVEEGGETWLVMEHVAGETLARLHERSAVPVAIASAIVSGLLRGLHAAHEAKDATGAPLGLVHRDVSPQNVLVGADGITRVLDFGIAKAAGRMQLTRPGYVRGKLAYMAPEQVRGEPLSRASDVFAAGVVLWELVTGKRLFEGDSPAAVEAMVLGGTVTPPSQVVEGLPAKLDRVVLRAVARDASLRFASAEEMAEALEAAAPPAPAAAVAAWVEGLLGEALRERAALVARVEKAREEESAARIVVEEEGEVRVPRAKRRWPALVVAGGAAAVLVLAAMRGAPGPGAAVRPVDDAGSVILAPSASPESPSERDAGRAEAPPASAPSAKGAKPTVKPRVPPSPPPASARPAPREGCDPPYVVDEAGHRRFKRECL